MIRDSKFLLAEPAGVQLGLPTVLIPRNHDIIECGFTSCMLDGLSVTAESEGVFLFGKGIGGSHIKPHRTLVIRFTPERPGQYGFRCDLHPQMKGEVFLMELGRG